MPRSAVLNLKGQESAESPFCTLQVRRQRNPTIQANVLVSNTGAVAGWALLAPDTRWFGDVRVMDVYTHPHFTDRLPELAASVALPDAPVAAYLTEPRRPRAAALGSIGLEPIATLPNWVEAEGRRDLTMWSRRT